MLKKEFDILYQKAINSIPYKLSKTLCDKGYINKDVYMKTRKEKQK